MKHNLEDLSYSGLVAKIQNDKNIGREILIDIVTEFEEVKKEKIRLEAELNLAKTKIEILKTGTTNILNHLGLSVPLAIIIPEGLAVISSVSISIERNVL